MSISTKNKTENINIVYKSYKSFKSLEIPFINHKNTKLIRSNIKNKYSNDSNFPPKFINSPPDKDSFEKIFSKLYSQLTLENY